jgi:glycosyltransferase involved in cell wall biosynthesis
MTVVPEISVVIPFYNEAEVAGPVIDELAEAMNRLGRSFEILLVDDGSSDQTANVLARAQERWRCCRILRHPYNLGQGAALWHGLHMARGAILVTLDGDGQNDPADLPMLLQRLEATDLVVGIRTRRQDSWLRRAMSKVANAVRRRWLGDAVHDTGCALRVFRREVLESFLPIRTLYSFIPAFAAGAGFRVVECPVGHRARRAGESKYGLRVMLWRPFVDMLAIGWLLRRRLPRVHVPDILPPERSSTQ